MTVAELRMALSHYPDNAIVYCNEEGRYDDRREITFVDAALGRDTVFIEHSALRAGMNVHVQK